MNDNSMPTLTLVSAAGHNKHKQRLVLVQCSCGSPAFICREDSYKQGRTKSCGCSRPGKQSTKAASVAVSISERKSASSFERNSPAWFADKISSAIAAAETAEKHVQDLQVEIAASQTTDLDLIKRWTAESKIARQLRQDISRFQIHKERAETAVKKDTRSLAEINRDKILALQG
jgi:hypothetical protein